MSIRTSRDISVIMYIEIKNDPMKSEKEQHEQISYILNECCSKLENEKFNVFYKMKDSDNKEIHLDF